MTIDITTPADQAAGQQRTVDEDGIVAVHGIVPRSQLCQDLWVLAQLNGKRGGTFVDIGAHDGVHFSNTYLLEREYQWTGVCVECSSAYEALRANRKAVCINKAAWSTSGEALRFNQHSESMLSSVGEGDATVETISLNDICAGLGSIDYLSLDTEGTEAEILSTFDFEKYAPQCMTIEHNNNGANLSEFIRLFERHGYLWRLFHWDVFAVKDGWRGA